MTTKGTVYALLTEVSVIQVPDNDIPEEQIDEWYHAENITKNTIIEYLADSFICVTKPEYTAKDILKNLDAIYECKSLATQLAFRKILLSLKLEGDKLLIRHFTNFENLITELIAASEKLK